MTTAQNLKSKTGVVGATIILKTGQYFDFLDPKPETIHIEDIAQGLSQTARFGGQALNFYSVAQHSVLVSRIVPESLRFAALMHDAAEAYIGDIVGPLKQLLPDYKVIEKRVEAAVCERFGLTLEDISHPEIKRADLRLLRTEQRDLTSGAADEWNGLSQYPPLEKTIEPLSWLGACTEFLVEFDRLQTKPTPVTISYAKIDYNGSAEDLAAFDPIVRAMMGNSKAEIWGEFTKDEAESFFDKHANQCFGIRKSIMGFDLLEFEEGRSLPAPWDKMEGAAVVLKHSGGDTIVWNADGEKIKSEWD